MLLTRLAELRKARTAGFEQITIDHKSEYRDALRLGEFPDPEQGFSEIHRRRSYVRPRPSSRAISTIHKAKGLECENAMVVPCDAQSFSGTDYARCKLYVAISRAKSSLALVVSRDNPSPLLKT